MKPLKYRNDWVSGTAFILIIIAGLFLGAAQFFQPQSGNVAQSGGVQRDLLIAGIHSLTINYPDGKVNLSAGTGDSITFREYTMLGLAEKDNLSVITENGIATVSVLNPKGFPFNLFNFTNPRLEVTVPQSLLDNLKSIQISTTNGDIDLPNLKTDQLEIKTASGDIKNGRLTATNAVISTISGSISDLEIQADQLDLATVSGKISTAKLTGGTLKVRSVSESMDHLVIDAKSLTMNSISGDIKADVNSPTNSISTTSGNIQIKLGPSISSGEFKSISGNVGLIIPDDTVEIEYSTTSGNIKINTVQIRNNGRISVSTTSGNIDINPQ